MNELATIKQAVNIIRKHDPTMPVIDCLAIICEVFIITVTADNESEAQQILEDFLRRN